MKKLITVIAFVFCGSSLFSQIYTPTIPTVYGSNNNRIKSLFVLGVPSKDTTTNTSDTSAQIFYRIIDSTFWGWSQAKGFFKVAKSGDAYSRTEADSIAALKVNVKDSGVVYVTPYQLGAKQDSSHKDTSNIIQLGSGTRVIYADGVSANIYAKTLIAGSNVTITPNADSSLTISASVGGSVGNSDSLNHVVGSSYVTRPELIDTASAIRSSIPLPFNPIAGTNVTLSGSYPNITFSSTASGATNANIGSGYRLAIPFTNNIKTIFAVDPILLDSVTNTNALTFLFDTSLYHSTAYNNTLYGSLLQQNTNTSNIATNTANISSNTTAIAGKQNTITLTTTGTSGAATLSGATLNIPQYTGGGGSTDTTSLSNRINKKQQNLGWVNVLDYGADSTGATDNSTAFAAAIATFTGKGGTLFVPRGHYLFTSTFTVNKQIRIVGEGIGKLYGYYPGTQISCATNIDVWKITAAGVQIEDLGFVWTGGSNPTSARALWVYNTDADVSPNMPDVSQKLTLRDFSVRGFYNNIYIEKCSNWVIDNVEDVAPINYGLHIENTTNQDAGDWSISNSLFFQPMSTPGGIGIHQTGSGGGKIVNTKFNGALNYDIWDSLSNSVILLVSNCSFENFVYEALHILNTAQFKISGCEFDPYAAISGTAIIYIKSSSAGIIASNTFRAGNASNLALKFDACTNMTAGLNNYKDFTSATPYLISGGSSNGIIEFNGSHYNANIQGVNYQLDQGQTQLVTYGTTTTFDASLGKSGYVTLTGNTTLAITNFNEGDYLTLVVIQDATGGRTMTLPTGILVVNGGIGTVALTVAAAARDVLCFTKIGGVIYCTIGKNYN